MYERQLRESEDSEYSVQAETEHLKERVVLLEAMVSQTKQEGDYYIKQILDLEKELKLNPSIPSPPVPAPTPVEIDHLQTSQMEADEKVEIAD